MSNQKLCNFPGCPRTVPIGQKYCQIHSYLERRDQERERPFFASYKREEYDALYHSQDWRKLKASVLNESPCCAICGAKATEVHHKNPHRGNREIFFDRGNLVSLCHDCHFKITQQEIQERKEKKEVIYERHKRKKYWY